MNDDRTERDEPAPTQEKKPETIQGEEDVVRETSTRTADGVIPSGYGSSGGFIPPQKERPADDHA
ncbi:MAG TPA: hypothetical protein VMA36_06315 [Candidatus Limnocylindria bacterium]|jgi:hypothetical protein|nr:hypothetical protein [Candidatus Limnocylindria bacterium]